MKSRPVLKETVTRFGQRMYVDPSDYIGKTILDEGVFDSSGLDFIVRLLDRIKARNVLDVGGNIGNHALVFSLHAEHVWSFEPNPAAWKIFEKNIEANDVTNITLCRFGLSNAEVEANMYVNMSGNLGGSTLRLESRLENNEYVTEGVPLRVGDDWARQINIGPVDFIKLDIEGHEGAALSGMRELVLVHRPLIIMEWNHISDREGVCNSSIYKELAETYTIYGIYKAADKKYWKGKPLGAIRRIFTKMRKGKSLTVLPLSEHYKYPGMNIRDLLLVPKEKAALLG